MNRRGFCLGVAATAGIGALGSDPAGAQLRVIEPTEAPRNGQTSAPDVAFRRIVHARVFHGPAWTLPGETPESVGGILAALRPSLVSGLIRLSDDESLAAEHLEAFAVIRRIVLATRPDARFDFAIDARSSADRPLIERMKEINGRIRTEQWTIAGLGEAHRTNPEAVAEVIAYTRSRRQLIGGDVIGGSLPPAADFAVVSDRDGLNRMLGEVQRARKGGAVPVISHIEGEAEGARGVGAETFVAKWSTSDRIRYVTKLAEQQATSGYRLMYPVFYPEYPPQGCYNAARDGAMLATLRSLIERYSRL